MKLPASSSSRWRGWGTALSAFLLAACSGAQAPSNTAQPQDLESAAIERGLVRDPADSDVAGLYARDTDRLCVVRRGMEYRVGTFVDYGDGVTCSGSGTLTRSGGTLRVDLGSACSFDARFDGERIAFPGALPDACKRLCTSHAALSGLDVERMSESVAEAQALRDTSGRALCRD